MGINKYRPHLLILSEDDAVRQIVVGFLSDTRIDLRRVQPMPVYGGWTHVRDQFRDEFSASMRSYPHRHILLAIDCDLDTGRIERLLEEIPEDIRDRVFVLASLDTPEELARAMNTSKETIGSQLADECAEGLDVLWSHRHLRHNRQELARLTDIVAPFLFTT